MSGERIPGAAGFDLCELCGKLKPIHRPWHCLRCEAATVTAPEALAVAGIMAAIYAWHEWWADRNGFRRGLEYGGGRRSARGRDAGGDQGRVQTVTRTLRSAVGALGVFAIALACTRWDVRTSVAVLLGYAWGLTWALWAEYERRAGR